MRRKDFPILSTAIYKHPLVYLDNAATTQKPQAVLDRLQFGYAHQNANIHRGVHYLSNQATLAHEEARQTVCDFLHARDKREIIFTRGTTESVNLLATCLERLQAVPTPSGLRPLRGADVVVSLMEHHSNFVPWQQLCARTGATLRVIPICADGSLDMDAYRATLSERTALVAICQVSNVLGTVNPSSEIIRLAHSVGAAAFVDGAQAVPHMAVDLQQLDADYYAFSGHKIYAPTGTGVFYGKAMLLEQLPPYQYGGEMIGKVRVTETTWNELPWKFEAGTPDYIGSTALAEAIRYVQAVGIDQIAQHEQQLTQYALQQLRQLPDIRIFGHGPGVPTAGVISFLVGTIHPYDLGMLLDKLGIAVRTGHHCAEPLIDHYDIPGTVRISFGLYNDQADIDALMAALNRVIPMLS